MGAKRKVTVREAAEEWRRHSAAMGLKPTTLAGRKAYANGYLCREPIGSRLTQTLIPSCFSGIHVKPAHGRHGSRVAPTGKQSQRHYRSQLKQFLTWCAQNDLLSRSVEDLLSSVPNIAPRRSVNKRRLSPEQLLAALESCEHPRDRMIIALGIFTGFRSSEIRGLTIGDVDLDGGMIRVYIPKTDEEDTFPICVELEAEIRRFKTWYAAEAMREGMGPLGDDWYFVPAKWSPQHTAIPGESGAFMRVHDGPIRPADPVTLDITVRVAHRALAAVGMDGRGEGMHTFRRSAGRAFFDLHRGQGVDHALLVAQTFLHHTEASTTQRYLGVDHERSIRNEALRGKPFLSALLPPKENVVDLAARREAEGLT